MKKTNIIIFVIIIVVIAIIFGYAIWDANKSLNELGNENMLVETEANNEMNGENINNDSSNNIQTNEIVSNNTNQINSTGTNSQGTVTNQNNYDYVGDWYISQEAYRNAEEIDHILDMREDNLITDEEFERQMASNINTNIVELDVDRYIQNQIKFDFKVTSPAPTQREADLDNIIVNLDQNVGTFTYTDNWGNSGNGTITLKDKQIELRLETTSAAQGALWGVEGVYTFSYKRVD